MECAAYEICMELRGRTDDQKKVISKRNEVVTFMSVYQASAS
jgi:hypothetical protein